MNVTLTLPPDFHAGAVTILRDIAQALDAVGVEAVHISHLASPKAHLSAVVRIEDRDLQLDTLEQAEAGDDIERQALVLSVKLDSLHDQLTR